MTGVASLLEQYKIAHVGFVAEDRSKAMERFGELYGIRDWQMVEWKPQRYVYKGREYNDVYVRIAISLPNEGTRIELLEPVTEIFQGVLAIPGVSSVSVMPCCIDRPNRYDLMIEIEMEKEALEAYDGCETHRLWKETYGDLLEKKAIFDCLS